MLLRLRGKTKTSKYPLFYAGVSEKHLRKFCNNMKYIWMVLLFGVGFCVGITIVLKLPPEILELLKNLCGGEAGLSDVTASGEAPALGAENNGMQSSKEPSLKEELREQRLFVIGVVLLVSGIYAYLKLTGGG